MDYKEYLRSDGWAEIKRELYQERGKQCQRCGEKKTLQVHHLTYERVYHEQLEDLLILCAVCHTKEHGLEVKKKRKHWKPNKQEIYKCKLKKLTDILTAGVISQQTYDNVKLKIKDLK